MLLLFLAVHFILVRLLAFEKRCSLCCWRSPVQTTSLLYLFDIFFLFVCYVDAEQWRMCVCKQKANNAQTRSLASCTTECGEIFVYTEESAKNEISQKDIAIAIILNVVQRVKVRDDI